MSEVWKDIKGFEGLYEISSFGRVRSIGRMVVHSNNSKKFIKSRIRKLNKVKNGYLMVHLFKEGKCKSYSVHRLVAQAFIPNPDNLPEINHISEIKTDNRVENLEWCDRKYNVNYGTARQRMTKTLSRTVFQYTLDGEFVAEYPSTKEVERKLGYKPTSISQCCNGKQKTSYGYFWSYEHLDDETLQRTVNKINKLVYQYTLNGELIKEWTSTHEVERQLGYSNGNISQCCNGKRKLAYGYKWSYHKLSHTN